MRYPNLNSILFAPWRRIVSFVLAMVLFTTSAPFPAFSVESGEQGSGGQSGSVSTPNSGELIYDYDTLKITQKGEQISHLDLLHHEKIEIEAEGLTEDADYQWQVQHPEKDDVWVNVYDGTKQTISVTMALVENVLRENGTAKLRCRAYTDTYAYLSNSVTVTVLHEQAVTMSALYAMPRVTGSAVVADAVDTPEFVTITINYIRYYYSDGELVLAPEEAFPSYVATLTYNAPRPNAVPCPELVGYQASIERVTVGGVDDPAAAIFGNDQITLKDANITSDIVITVRYNPKQVQYQVRYFFQNVYDDLYVEDDSLKGPLLDGSGFTGTTPDLKQQNVPGFTCLFYEPDSIAADGSTVFYVYYERNYYLMEFDCDGGYGTDTVYVRYGTHVVVPDPVRSGYVFAGWDLVSCKDDNGDAVELPGTTAVGTADSLPATLPHYNTIYKAIWQQADTKYKIAYWIVNDDGTRSYLGGRLEEATTGTTVSGLHDLGLADGCGAVCGNLGHVHTDECYDCTATGHTHHLKHDLSCYTGVKQGNAVADNHNDMKAIQAANAVNSSVIDESCVYFYFIQAGNDAASDTYWPKIRIGGSYYTVTINDNDSINKVTLDSFVDGGEVARGTASNNYTAIIYKAKNDCGKAICVSQCGVSPHTHSASCRQNTRHLNPIDSITLTGQNNQPVTFTTSQGVVIEGDGSSVVDIYYQYKQYTLKFYYAATEGGTDSDADGINDTGFTSVKIVGGSTYHFGYHYGTDTADDDKQLNKMFYENSGQCGEVTELPSLNATGEDRDYTESGLKVDRDGDGTIDVTYHYISFQARYGDDISHLWPCGVFNSATRTYPTNDNGWTGTGAFVSAWNGEHHVAYSRNGNETIKGVYEKLDEQLLFHTDYEDSTEVSYLCFWENGANIKWSIPELYIYNIWLPCVDNKQENAPAGKETKYEDNTWYYLESTYNTCDDSSISEQTEPGLEGYTFRVKKWSTYFVTDAKYYETDDYYYVISNDKWEKKYQSSTMYSGSWEYTKAMQIKQLDDGADGEDRYIVYDEAVYDPDSPGSLINHNLFREAYAVDFYYTATTHKLVFWNHSDYLTNGTGVPLVYGYPLAKYGVYTAAGTDYMKAHYPDSLEPGAYEFVSWYTTAECLDGTEMDWSESMPDSDLTVYAKYVPIERYVYFYLTYDNMTDYLSLSDDEKAEAGQNYFWQPAGATTDYPIEILHGSVLGTAHNHIPERYIDKNGNGQIDADETEKYSFVGWFYIDENGKKRFAPDTMEVKRDLHLFAEWRTEMDTEYTINYVMQDSKVSIAEPTNGHMSVGHTKTFEAKSGSQLYDAYQDKTLFPTTSSHSILMEPKAEDNTFTFEYVEEDSVWYQVKYVNKVTGVELGSEKAEKSKNAIVTTKYKAFAGYIPESYYITRVLTADGDATAPIAENIIVFYYIPTETTALYTVQLYQEKLDSTDASKVENYELVQSAVFSGIIGNTMEYEVDSDRFAGFTYKFNTVTDYVSGSASTVTNNNTALGAYLKPSGKLTDMGLEFKIYYSRNTVEYTIQFLEWGTGEPLGYGKLGYNGEAYSEKDTSVYKVGSTHSFTAPNSIAKNDITYYFFETDEKKQTQSLTMQANKDTNVLTFYFKAKEVTIYYHAICLTPGAKDQDFGRVSQSHEFITSSTVNGSTAMPSSGFKFVGWFTTQECKDMDRVPDNYVDGNGRLTPSRPNADVHYYALFAPLLSRMTIMKTVDRTTDDNFLFRIQGVGKTAYIDIIVSISGNGSVTLENLPVGDYIVTELTDWSWEYTAETESYSVTVSQGVAAAVAFSNTYAEPDWLGGEGSNENKFN